MPRRDIERFASVIMKLRGDADTRACLAALMELKAAHTLQVAWLLNKSPALVAKKLDLLAKYGFLNKREPEAPQTEFDAYYNINGLFYRYRYELRVILHRELQRIRQRTEGWPEAAGTT